jgi:hypothetical protein
VNWKQALKARISNLCGPILRVAILILAVAFAGAAVSIVLIGFPRWRTIYSADGTRVKYVEVGDLLEFNVRAPANILPSFVFDYRQDGLVGNRKLADPSYSVQQNGALCTQYKYFDYAATLCGGLVSTARVIAFTRSAAIWDYTLAIPEKELSSSGKSASMVLEFWNDTVQVWNSYPSERFKRPILITYTHRKFDLRRFLYRTFYDTGSGSLN